MSEVAERVWERMRELVLDRYDRRKQVANELGMSFAKVKALRWLAGRPRTMRELAEALAIDRPYATLIVDDLEARGLAARSVHPDDRRRKIVTVTEQGKAKAERAGRILKEPPAAVLGLADEDLAKLDEILARLSEKS
ncbi:MAG TPA: MarR family transcriptional regulator [Amycolatopsis sp.]|nr:MarR family transcriptional regulator [Amycolatopsis sp.]